MNLKKIGHEDKKRILSLYLTKIGECSNCGKCQYCCYKYIIYNLRNKKFTITTKQGVIREMPSFENMEKFGYTILQTPLESLIISYPIPGLKQILDNIPSEKFSEEISPSFSESSSTKEEEEEEEDDEEEEPIKSKPKSLIIESSSSEEGSEPENNEELPDIEESISTEKSVEIKKPKKPLIIEDSDDDTEEVLKQKREIIEGEISNKKTDEILRI